MGKQIFDIPTGAKQVVIETQDPVISFVVETPTSSTTSSSTTKAPITSTTTSTTKAPATTSTTTLAVPDAGYQLLYNFTLEQDDPTTKIIQGLMDKHNQHGSGSLTTFDGQGVFKADARFSGSVSRSEIQFDENPYTPAEGAYEFDVYLASIPSNGGGNGLCSQFHGYASGTSGQGAMWFSSNTDWQIVEQVDNKTNTYWPAMFKFQTGKWYTVRHEVKFTSLNNGYWRTFIAERGQPLPSVPTFNSGARKTSDGGGQYFKIGLYFWINVSALGYIGNIKIFKKI